MSLRIAARYPDAFSVLSGVAAGLGVAVLSEPLARICVPGVVFRKISIVNKLIDHAIALRKNERSPVVKAFVDMLRKNNRLT
jgi:DNA-binding transcriptional LysR family regulator